MLFKNCISFMSNRIAMLLTDSMVDEFPFSCLETVFIKLLSVFVQTIYYCISPQFLLVWTTMPMSSPSCLNPDFGDPDRMQDNELHLDRTSKKILKEDAIY